MGNIYGYYTTEKNLKIDDNTTEKNLKIDDNTTEKNSVIKLPIDVNKNSTESEDENKKYVILTKNCEDLIINHSNVSFNSDRISPFNMEKVITNNKLIETEKHIKTVPSRKKKRKRKRKKKINTILNNSVVPIITNLPTSTTLPEWVQKQYIQNKSKL